MLEELKRPHGRRILVCPVCGSTDVTYYMGLKIGYQYQCKTAIMWEPWCWRWNVNS